MQDLIELVIDRDRLEVGVLILSLNCFGFLFIFLPFFIKYFFLFASEVDAGAELKVVLG